MKIENLPLKILEAIPILRKIQESGYEAYFVGGCVRDTILNLPLHDIDIATNAYPYEIKKIFNKTVDIGIEHGTVMILYHGLGYEITTFRTESTYQDYRRPDHVTFVRSLYEDLKRRDLTINALAMNSSGYIIDHFNGISDIRNHIIRAVGDPQIRYHEDALRMMRSLRFMSQLGFHLESNTEKAIYDNAYLLKKIAIERIHVEWIKLMLGISPQVAIREFIYTNLYKYCPDFIEYRSNLLAISNINNFHLLDELECWILTGCLFHLDNSQLEYLMYRWKNSREMIIQTKLCCSVIRSRVDILNPNIIYDLGLKLLLSVNHILKLLNLSSISDNNLKEAYIKLPIKNMKDIQLNGNDLIKELDIKSGPKIGKILSQIKEMILNKKILNDHSLLILYVKNHFIN